MARKTKTNANNSNPKGPVVIEDTVEDAVEVTADDTTTDTSEAMSAQSDSPETTAVAAEETPPTPDDTPGAETMPEADRTPGTDTAPDAVDMPGDDADRVPDAEVIDENTSADAPDDAPVPPAPNPLAPAPQVTVQKVGFVPLVLGGVIAAALGFAAAWFYFGQQDTALADQIAAQSTKITELETQIAALPTEPPAPVDLSGIEASITQTNDSITALTARVDEIGTGIATDVAAFEERVTAVERTPGVDGTLAATAIASWERELDTLRAEIAAQQDRMQGIATTAEADLEATRAASALVEQEAIAAAEQAIARAALARVQVALDSGAPFEAAMAALTDAGTEAPAALADVAADGVPTLSALNDGFAAAARAALAAARTSGEADVDSNPLTAFLRNQFDVRSVAPREGDDPDAVLSRAGAALAENNLADALAELESLPEVSRAEMSDWIGQAQARFAAMAAVDSLDQSMNN